MFTADQLSLAGAFISGSVVPYLLKLGIKYSKTIALAIKYSKDGYTADEIKEIFERGLKDNEA